MVKEIHETRLLILWKFKKQTSSDFVRNVLASKVYGKIPASTGFVKQVMQCTRQEDQVFSGMTVRAQTERFAMQILMFLSSKTLL